MHVSPFHLHALSATTHARASAPATTMLASATKHAHHSSHAPRAAVSRKIRRERGRSLRSNASVDDVAAAPSVETKMEIFALAACSRRGESATTTQRDEIRALVRALDNPTTNPARSEKLNGSWELVFESSGHPFRSSPFFWAVGKFLGDRADFFYGAHEHQTSMFGGGCGTCLQILDMNAGTLTSDCVVKASIGIPFLGFAPIVSGFGSVITKGTVQTIDGETIAVPVVSLSTTVRQDDESVLPALNFLNNTTVPVGDVMGRIADGNSEMRVTMRITYLDDDMRVSELEDGTLLIYRRRA